MFYQYNNFTGRLTGNKYMTPYYPVGPKPLSKNESPKIMFETPYVKIAQETQVRPSSTRKMVPGTTEFYSDVPEALKKKMELFQLINSKDIEHSPAVNRYPIQIDWRKDGVPIHLKGGAPDRLLFGLTATLCAVGLVSVFHMIYTMSYPKKK